MTTQPLRVGQRVRIRGCPNTDFVVEAHTGDGRIVIKIGRRFYHMSRENLEPLPTPSAATTGEEERNES